MSLQLNTDFYAPTFRVEVDHRQLDPAANNDVLDVKVVMDMENMTSFDITFNNWDDRTHSFKYSDEKVFDVGKDVHVELGYGSTLRSMVRGQITTMRPRFAESGPPTVSISGLDGMVRLRDRKPVGNERKTYVNKTDSEIAEQIARRHHLEFEATETTERHPLVVQKNQDDASFLMERAKRIDFDCFILADPDPQSRKSTLHFVKPTDRRDGSAAKVYRFEWGQNLNHFTPTLTAARQVSSVTVRGWDPQNKAVISYKATARDLPGGGRNAGLSGPQAAESRFGAKEDVVIDAPVMTEAEARRLAIALLRKRAYDFITGAGQVIGFPDLRPGFNVYLDRLGTRFKGEYYLTRVEHSFGSNGYVTDFTGRRVYDGGTT